MTEKELLNKYGIPKKHRSLKVCLNNDETLYVFLTRESLTDSNFCFDVICKGKDGMAICGLQEDINKFLMDTLLFIKITDLYAGYYFFSEITGTNYYRFILKYETMEELRSILNERRKSR